MISPQHSDLIRIWNNLRGRRSIPRVSDITAPAIAAHLHSLLIIEEQPGGEAKIRLAGTAVCALLGREVSGLVFDDLWDARDQADLARMAEAIFHDGSVIIIGAIGHREAHESEQLSVLLLPVEAEKGRPRRLIGTFALPHTGDVSLFPITKLQIASIRILDADRTAMNLTASGFRRTDVALQRGHLVLLNGNKSAPEVKSVIRR
jgi:hypothetical protein